jgi:hypothetical protein
LHVWNRPQNGAILLPGVSIRPESGRMLVGGAVLSHSQSPDGVLVNLPAFSDDSPVHVAVLKFSSAVTTDQKMTGPQPDGRIRLSAADAELTGPDDAKPLINGDGGM